MSEQGVQAGAVVLQPGGVTVNTETHVADLRRNTQSVHQLHEIGVRPVIENDKTGVDRPLATTGGDHLGIGMAPGIVAGLEQLYIVLFG